MKIKNKLSAKLFIPLLLTSFLATNCKKEREEFPESIESTSDASLKDSLGTVAIASSEVSSDAYRLERSLPDGYVKDGSKDYTSYVQTVINKYSEIVFPGFPILINDSGLKIPSNRKIYFLNGSVLRLKPTSRSTYSIIKINRASNVTLIDPVIRGDRKSHLGSSGEWGNGLAIYSSVNVNIINPKVYDCWGDGIYLGKTSSVINKNIKITNAYCRNNRRDGISIICADGLLLDNPYVGYTNGTAPQCGINIEPNTSIDQLRNIDIINATTEHNKGNGIQIGLTRMYSSSSNKTVSINLENHKDIGSGVYAFKISCRRPDGYGYLSGAISLSSSKLHDYLSDRPTWISINDSHVKAKAYRPSVTDENGNIVTSQTSIARIMRKGLKSGSELDITF